MSQNVRVNAAVSDPQPTENSGAAEAQQRIAELTAQIEQAIEDYYIHDAPTMADADYDRLELELRQLEADNPQLAKADSPTQTVHGAVAAGFTPTTHIQRLMRTEHDFELEDYYVRTA